MAELYNRPRRFLQKLMLFPLAILIAIAPILSAGAVEVSGKAAALISLDSGEVLYEKNGQEQLSMASTTKIMTALVALEHGNMEDVVTVPAEAAGIEGSSMYLKAGEKLTLSDLIYGLMLHSGNDAAVAIAIHVGGNVPGFVQLMNQTAAELGLLNTSFANPNGLDDTLHYTSAIDLARLTCHAMKNDAFAQIVGTKSTVLGDEESGRRYLTNHNKMLRIYDGATGVKTGFTKKSGRCLVSAATRDGVSLVAVTLSAPDDWNDHRTMLDYGFSLLEKREISQAGTLYCNIPIYGSTVNMLPVYTGSTCSVVLKKESAPLEEVVELPRFCYASVAKGQIVGQIKYYQDGTYLAAVPLIAGEDCMQIAPKADSLWEKFLNFFRK